MKVKFRVNLGSRDAKDMKLDYEKCTEGSVVEVEDGTAERLIGRGIATLDEQKAIPASPAMKGK